MLGIYVHWPFCKQKCSYCSFISSPNLSEQSTYAKALVQEICSAQTGAVVNSIFFGGGTPSLCPSELFAWIMATIGESFALDPDCEITIEANPGTLTEESLCAFRESGVNRLSMGLQATQPELLHLLGRIHSLKDFENSFNWARKTGFSNLGVDLIYGIPGQTMEDWRETLTFVASFRPEHISLYALTLEEGTALFSKIEQGCIPDIDDDLAADMYVEARRRLAEHGYRNYEISNFALPGRECRHNLKYWTQEDYLGFGVASHSLIENTRFAHTTSVEKYVSNLQQGKPVCEVTEVLDARAQEEEYLMLRTRLAEGFSMKEKEKLFGPGEMSGLHQALKEGLLCARGDRYLPTERGFLFQNRLALLLTQDV